MKISHSLKEQRDIVHANESGESRHVLANRFNCDRSTISRLIKRKDKILEALASGKSENLKRIKKVKYLDVEVSLIPWIKEARSQNIPITGDLMRVWFFGFSLSIFCSNAFF